MWGPSGMEYAWPYPFSGCPVRLTRQLLWFFSAATESDPEMMNCVGEMGPQ